MVKRFVVTAVLITLLCSICSGVPSYNLKSVRNLNTIEQRVDAYIKPYLDLGGFSGSILIAKRGQVSLAKGYGMANYELNVPNKTNTKFHLGSVSKTFTAAAIMILQEHGKLSVRDPLLKFIPDYPNGDRILIHHLLTNTSGIPNVNNFPEYANQAKFHHTPADLIEMFKNKPLDFDPGSRGYVESNSNYNLLAFIIEKLSGQTYGEFLKQNIFDPLGMNDTGHDGNPDALITNRASGYVPTGVTEVENVPYMDWSIKTGNGSIYSTVEDLYRWDRALYTERILKKASLEQMFKEQYGWFNSELLNRKSVGISGRSPGFSADFRRFINDDACVIVLGNNYVPTAGIISVDLARIVFGEKYEAPHLIKPPAIDAKVEDKYVGRYQFGQDFFGPGAIYTVERKGDQLRMHSSGDDTTLVPQSDTEFFHRTYWSMIIFVKDANGNVNQLLWRYGGRDYRAVRVSNQ
jgi:CubicO group peptidase (beta-lactamase class C family)